MYLTYSANFNALPHKLILAGTAEEFATLSHSLAELAPDKSLAIHDRPDVRVLATLSLVVALNGRDRIVRQAENDYVWHLSSDSRLEAVEKIDVLAGLTTSGHQYFESHPADGVTIEMSVGEYDFTTQKNGDRKTGLV